MSTEQGINSNPENHKPRFRLGWLSRVLLLLGALVLLVFLAWPLYAPHAVRFAADRYVPEGWQVSVATITAGYQATRLDGVTVTTPLGVRAKGLRIDIVHQRALLTNKLTDIDMRLQGGTISIARQAMGPGDQTPASQAVNERLDNIMRLLLRAFSLSLPGTDIIPIGLFEIDEVALEIEAFGQFQLNGAGGNARDVSVSLMGDGALTVALDWRADATLTANLTASSLPDIALLPVGLSALTAQIEVPRGQVMEGISDVRVTGLTLPPAIIPPAFVPLIGAGFDLDLRLEPALGLAAKASFVDDASLALTMPWPDPSAAPDYVFPITIETQNLAVQNWRLTMPSLAVDVWCCADGVIVLRTDELALGIASDRQNLAGNIGGDLFVSYGQNDGALGIQADLAIQGTTGPFDNSEVTNRLSITGAIENLRLKMSGQILRWPGVKRPALDYTIEGDLTPQRAEGRVSLDVPSLTGFPTIALSYDADLATSAVAFRLPSTQISLRQDWLNPIHGLAPPWLFETITALNGEITIGGQGQYAGGVSGTVSVAGDIKSAEVFGTAITGIKFDDQLNFANGRLRPSQAVGRLNIERWGLGDALALTDMATAWEWQRNDTLALRPLTAGLLGGELRVDGFDVPLPLTALETTVTTNGLSLEQLAQALDVPGLSMTGDMNGQVGLTLTDNLWRLVDGQFTAEGGRLRYRGAVADAAVAEQANLAFDVLENFEYDNLTMSLNGVIGGDQSARLRLVGRNPAVYDGYPVDLNINLSGALDAIAQRSLDALAIPDRLARQLAPQ